MAHTVSGESARAYNAGLCRVELHDLSADCAVLCVLRGPEEPITCLDGEVVTFSEASSALESALSRGAGDLVCELQGRAWKVVLDPPCLYLMLNGPQARLAECTRH